MSYPFFNEWTRALQASLNVRVRAGVDTKGLETALSKAGISEADIDRMKASALAVAPDLTFKEALAKTKAHAVNCHCSSCLRTKLRSMA